MQGRDELGVGIPTMVSRIRKSSIICSCPYAFAIFGDIRHHVKDVGSSNARCPAGAGHRRCALLMRLPHQARRL